MSDQGAIDKSKKQKRRRVFFNTLSLLIVLGAIIWSFVSYYHLDDSLYTDDAQVEEYINPVNARISGYIREIRFEEHQRVKKGDTLVVIDDSEYKIQLQQALAALEDAQAGRTVARSDVGVAANSTEISEANLAEVKARLDNMAMNYRRYTNLLKEDVVSQYQFDQVKSEYDAMKARYLSMQKQKLSTTLSTQSASDKLNVSDAGIRKAQAAVDMAKLNLSYTVIVAPSNGTVGRRRIAAGQLLQAGQPLVTLVSSEDKWVTANYTESQIAKIKTGTLLNIKIDALQDAVFEGKVIAISEATGSRYSSVPVDNATGNFVKVQQRIPVRIAFTRKNKPEDLGLLRAGMNAEVTTVN